MTTPAKPPPEERKPWPMTWVAVSIGVFIVGYTFVNISYRKTEPAHEPWQEAQDRREQFVSESLMAWTRLRADLIPATSNGNLNSTTPAELTTAPTPGHLEDVVPKDLAIIMPERPTLRPAPTAIEAPAEIASENAYRLYLPFTEEGDAGEVLAYTKDRHLHIFLQAADAMPAGAETTRVSDHMDLRLPAGLLEAGDWRATLYAADSMFDWRFIVR